MPITLQYAYIKNPSGLPPIWVEIWIDDNEIAAIDWKNGSAVRELTQIMEIIIRSGKQLRIIPVL